MVGQDVSPALIRWYMPGLGMRMDSTALAPVVAAQQDPQREPYRCCNAMPKGIGLPLGRNSYQPSSRRPSGIKLLLQVLCLAAAIRSAGVPAILQAGRTACADDRRAEREFLLARWQKFRGSRPPGEHRFDARDIIALRSAGLEQTPQLNPAKVQDTIGRLP